MIHFSFALLEKQLTELKQQYAFLETGVAGNSVMGNNLYYVRLGKGPYRVFYNGAHHANEWITAMLLIRFISNYTAAYQSKKTLGGYNLQDLFNQSSIYIVPLVNPDGVDLVTHHPNYPRPVYQAAASLNTTGLPLPKVWKANLRGVDLNLNYPALWELEKRQEQQQGITRPRPRDFGGDAPLSEPESLAMVNFTRKYDFQRVIAYHTQGQEIYYQFNRTIPVGALELARQFAKISGYAIAANPPDASYAGYKDWFIQEYQRPGFTIEVGQGVNPIPVSQLDTIYRQNEGILLAGAMPG